MPQKTKFNSVNQPIWGVRRATTRATAIATHGTAIDAGNGVGVETGVETGVATTRTIVGTALLGAW